CDIRLAGDDAQHPPTGARHFARLCFALTHVDSEWRRVGLRHAWHTVYVDDRLPHSAIAEMRAAHGRHTRKMWVQVTFGGIASHYRRYLHARDNWDIQPFCDLHRWPRLRDLEISYEHKCAFPALAAYIEPRLGAVLAQMRGQLEKLSVIGLVAGDARARLDLDAVEFPRLERLLIAGQVHPSAGARDQPPLVSCRGMFAKVWPKLTHLCLPTLSSEDARAIGRTMPRLANICVRLAHVDRIQHSFDLSQQQY
ncbi:hypothetical protein IWQ56_001524, partial [Coemansia nantahalensis]